MRGPALMTHDDAVRQHYGPSSRLSSTAHAVLCCPESVDSIDRQRSSCAMLPHTHRRATPAGSKVMPARLELCAQLRQISSASASACSMTASGWRAARRYWVRCSMCCEPQSSCTSLGTPISSIAWADVHIQAGSVVCSTVARLSAGVTSQCATLYLGPQGSPPLLKPAGLREASD